MTDHKNNNQNLAIALLAQNLFRHPDKPAYICNDEITTYRQLVDSTCRFATALHEYGIKPCDRVMFVMPDSPVLVAVFLGTVLAGAIAVPVNTALPADDYRYIAEDSGAKLIVLSEKTDIAASSHLPQAVPWIVAQESLANWLHEKAPAPLEAPEPEPDDPAFILYTSGSTGQPKGVPHRHCDLLLASEQYAKNVLNITEEDLIFSASKLFFAYGLGNSLAFNLHAGATALLHSGKPLQDELLSLIARHRPTLFFSVPTIYAQIILATPTTHINLPMRLCISAGEALPASVYEEWIRVTGIELLDGIGSTELTHIFISNYPGKSKAGSTGQAVPGYLARLIDKDGNPVPPGSCGHLEIKGNTQAPSYWNKPEKSAATMLPDGFIKTGDLFIEKDGYYFHQGRSDDMLKVGGQWISPVQVEKSLASHPSVAECAVAACLVWGLVRPAAHLILKPEFEASRALEQELKQFLAERLQDYMLPVRYFFVNDLPRTSTGKVQRFKLNR